MALLSPPDPGTTSVFSFSPSTTHAFPDLADYQFLKPDLHGGNLFSSREKKEEDLYRRIESRLRGYQEASYSKNGLKKTKKKSSTPSAFENPFARKPFGDEFGLKKQSSSSSNF